MVFPSSPDVTDLSLVSVLSLACLAISLLLPVAFFAAVFVPVPACASHSTYRNVD